MRRWRRRRCPFQAYRASLSASKWLAARGDDPVFGARPLKRLIQKEVLDELARKVLGGELRDGEAVVVDAGPGGLSFRANLTEAPLVA